MEIQSVLARTVRNDSYMQKLLKGDNWGDCPDDMIHNEKSQELADMCMHITDSAAASVPLQEAEEVEEVFFAPNPNGIRTVVARNLPRDITLKELHAGFHIYGTIQDMYIPRNLDNTSPYYGTIRGFALIKYVKPLDAARAVAVGPFQLQKNIVTLEFAKVDHAPKGHHALSEGQKDHAPKGQKDN